LVVPNLEIDRLVLDGAELPNLAWGPGMTRGAQGHRVIAGHRDTHFRFLGDLAPGQRLQLETGGGEIVDWQVVERRIVDSRTTSIDLDAPGPLLTLLTCYPLEGLDSGTPFRLVLAARPLGRTKALETKTPVPEVLAWAP
jgi:sortase A